MQSFKRERERERETAQMRIHFICLYLIMLIYSLMLNFSIEINGILNKSVTFAMSITQYRKPQWAAVGQTYIHNKA